MSVSLGSLPEALKAFQNGWTELDTNNVPFEVVDEDDFFDEEFGSAYCKTLLSVANSIDQQLGSRGKDVNMVNTFSFLLHPAVHMLADFTSQQLVKSGKSPTTALEIQEFIATLLF